MRRDRRNWDSRSCRRCSMVGIACLQKRAAGDLPGGDGGHPRMTGGRVHARHANSVGIRTRVNCIEPVAIAGSYAEEWDASGSAPREDTSPCA